MAGGHSQGYSCFVARSSPSTAYGRRRRSQVISPEARLIREYLSARKVVSWERKVFDAKLATLTRANTMSVGVSLSNAPSVEIA